MGEEVGSNSVTRLESVTAVMPELSIYCYPGTDIRMEQVKVTYGEEILTVTDVLPYAKEASGISYYLLVDISASIGSSDFSQIQQGILTFHRNMKAEDDLTLISFGDQIRTEFTGQKNTQDITDIVNNLRNTDQTTLLFEAVKKMTELANTKEQAARRKVAVVITDGEDFSENATTENEALKALQESSIPLYGMAAKTMGNGSENTYINKMGEFIRSSGGMQKIFSGEEAGTILCSFQEDVQQACIIRAKAASNHVTYTSLPLTVTFADDEVHTMNFKSVYYTNDTIAPTATIEKISLNEFEVKFSEPVEYAGENGNYKVVMEEQLITDYHVQYVHNENKTLITFAEELKNGEYQVSFTNICDRSMEQNLLEKACVIQVRDGADVNEIATETEYTESVQPGSLIENYGLQMLLAGVGIVAAVCIIVICCIVKKRKGTLTVEEKAVIGKKAGAKHHVAIKKEQSAGKNMSFQIVGAVGKNNEIKVQIHQSLIVGRSDICDVYMDDEKMSRQHFVIYDRPEGFVIEDLHTTNGTLVNGRRIEKNIKLENGDRISAGDVEMIVRW